MDRPVVFVVASPRAGKSTVADIVASEMGTAKIASSQMVAARIEARLHLAPGTIAAERISDPEGWRARLVDESARMVALDIWPGVLCVEAGYLVIDGIRRGEELRRSIATARATGCRTLSILVNPGSPSTIIDNTELSALSAASDVEIDNDGDIDLLRQRVLAVLAAANAGGHLPRRDQRWTTSH